MTTEERDVLMAQEALRRIKSELDELEALPETVIAPQPVELMRRQVRTLAGSLDGRIRIRLPQRQKEADRGDSAIHKLADEIEDHISGPRGPQGRLGE